MEWGNLVFAGLVVTQAISHDGINFPVAIIGVLVFAASYAVAIRYLRGGE